MGLLQIDQAQTLTPKDQWKQWWRSRKGVYSVFQDLHRSLVRDLKKKKKSLMPGDSFDSCHKMFCDTWCFWNLR
jgi:hypothetical protein